MSCVSDGKTLDHPACHDYLSPCRLLLGRSDPRSLDSLWTPSPNSVNVLPYGFGFSVLHGPNGQVFGHSGGFPGMSAQFSMYLDRGIAVAVLSNYSGVATTVGNKIAEMVGRLKR